jgi:hypothetical protein
MALNIRNPEADRLDGEVAALSGEKNRCRYSSPAGTAATPQTTAA